MRDQMRAASGVVLVLVGVVWILQGLDVAFAPRSFMSGDSMWILWGGVTTVVGVALLVWSARARLRR